MTGRRWRLVVAPSAERSLGRVPEKVAAAIVEFMLGPLLENPRRVGHGLRRELEGLFAARRGAYWIVYELDDDAREVRVLRIDHRASDRYAIRRCSAATTRTVFPRSRIS